VTKEEPLFVRAYTLAQYYFGMYESTPYYFAESTNVFSTSTPHTYATIYRNDVWKDHLVVVANMNAEAKETSLAVRPPERLGLKPSGRYELLDVNEGKSCRVEGNERLKQGLGNFPVPGHGMKLFYLRELPHDGPHHLWGGKRISEKWDAESGKLTLELHGPLDSEDVILIASGARQIGEVQVNGQRGQFFVDLPQRVVHGKVAFGSNPVHIEVFDSTANRGELPEKPVPTREIPAR
jgi:hypothetical protein